MLGVLKGADLGGLKVVIVLRMSCGSACMHQWCYDDASPRRVKSAWVMAKHVLHVSPGALKQWSLGPLDPPIPSYRSCDNWSSLPEFTALPIRHGF